MSQMTFRIPVALTEYGVNARNSPLLGQIITWGSGQQDTTHAAILGALKTAGLDEKFARELLPRYTFARACHEMEEGRIIRKVDEDEEKLIFQFTKEALQGGEFAYAKETLLVLEKKTGNIDADDKAVEAEAVRLMAEYKDRRTASDVSAIVQRLFAKSADLFPVREQGGCYFVPNHHLIFVDKVESFLVALGGHVHRFPILAGDQKGTQSVKDVIQQGLLRLVNDHVQAITRLDADSRASTFEKRMEEIELTRVKAEGYAEFLKDQADAVYDALGLAKRELAVARAAYVDKRLESAA